MNTEVIFTKNLAKNSNNSQISWSGGAVFSKNSLISFEDQSKVTFHENRAVSNGGAICAWNYSKIIFQGNSTLSCTNNSAGGYGGAFIAVDYSFVSFGGYSTINFTTNFVAKIGGAVYASNITFHGHSKVTFKRNNAFRVGGAIAGRYAIMSFCEYSVVTFTKNKASLESGGAIFADRSQIEFYGNSTVTFSGNDAAYGGAIQIYLNLKAYNFPLLLSFGENSMITFSGNSARNYGGAVNAEGPVIISQGHTTVIFTRNHAGIAGGAINTASLIMSFSENSTINFTENNAGQYGGAVNTLPNYCLIYCLTLKIMFSGHTTVIFSRNQAQKGGAMTTIISTFTDHSTVIFRSNSASSAAGALMIDVQRNLRSTARVDFTGNSKVIFSNNSAPQGGAVQFVSNLHELIILFQRNTNVTFVNNKATQGGALYCSTTSQITFSGSAIVGFCNNTASLSGGAILLFHGNICFKGVSTIDFNNNLAKQHGGAISSLTNVRITFMETSSVVFTSNTAMQQGGAIYLFDRSAMAFKDNCTVSYNNNTALQFGGAVYFALQSIATFKGNSVINFEHNKAILSGGALYSFKNGFIHFEEQSNILFHHNMVRQDGGAIQSVNTTLHFSENPSVTFTRNTAFQQGGALNLFYNSVVTFQDKSNITFTHNTAMQHGGAVYVHDNSSVSFVGKTKVVFHHNAVESGGGALYSYNHSRVTIGKYSTVMFVSNNAIQCGGAIYCDRHSDLTLEGAVTFLRNTAEHGGAVCASHSILKFANNSVVTVNNNRAIENGGGLYFTDKCKASFDNGSSVTFAHNTAHRYGGALYTEINHEGLSKLKLDTAEIGFTDNRALTGNSAYLDIPTSCDEACLNMSVVDVNIGSLKHSPFIQHIHTPPRKLVLRDPAVCIDDDNVNSCGTYYVNRIMLGQEIIIDACVLDYYDQPAGETQFRVYSNDEDHAINGTNSVLISCAELQGINVTGSKISDAINFTMNLTSHIGSSSDSKTISIGLIIELFPCHPGFYYDDKRCACYHHNDIITCSGSTSLIRRGFWFGVVNDKSTVTICPNNYCNFTCCQVTNGFYKLSPVRMNQCSSHRSGTACGSCEEGYTLSFDSVECVSVDKCTTGQTMLVVTLSMIYWIFIVILVFIMTYYHVGIGYLYAITYYYSMVDILLSYGLYQTKRLFVAVPIISSIVKITPQFLGQFCLVEGMSGIDQQFIHYTHPLAVSVIIAIFCQAARISHRFSSFISRGIIHTVCFLFLLSYTSVATTSLLLLRSLTFANVDNIYTYLSPDIEYWHGRHFPYFIVAVLCTIVIVIGLPLLLLLEPFLNHKINFTRMKPLLDQFQGCYKDKYRCLAAYYMICRLVIIMIIISIPSSNDLSQFLLCFSSVVMTMIVTILKPYKHQILNLFDGLILLLVVLATLVPLAGNVSQQLLTATLIIVMTLPLIFFIALELIINKDTISMKIKANFKTKPVSTSDQNNEVPMCNAGLVIDDNMRKNATICEM